MASSADIKALYDHFSALVFILQSVQSCLADCENYYKPYPGSETMQSVIEFQAQVNSQLISLNTAIDEAYRQVDVANNVVQEAKANTKIGA